MPTRLMHVDLDAFFVEVCRQRRPELRDEPYLIVGGRRDGRGVVQSASYPCRALGVRSGMPSARAAQLCPQATFVKGEFAWYREASRTVRDVLAQFSPVVAMISLDEATLDYAGTEALFPVSLLAEAARVRDAVRAAAGLDVSIGIGPNRMVAKLASDVAKPRGLMEVRPGWEEGFMAGLTLAQIPGIGPRTARRLAELGLEEVHQVQARTLAELERLVGSYARELKLRAHGHGGTRIVAGRRARSVSRETTLAADARDPATLDRLLVRLAAEVAADLRGDGLEARTVVVKCRHDDFVTVTRRVTLPVPTALDAELLAAARPLLAEAFGGARRRDRGVRLIGIGATNLVEPAPPALFEPEGRRRQQELARATDKVRERFGFDALRPGRLIDPPEPA